ncbi:hypothetical protein ACRXCV_00400 (plasmid) [Halobacteriovorax sp. GFR7]|uniref:hypothetical protein n=1 Tax=unclassified Halobacteriovorax TaxID=2639665 RepID=UPI003D957897
MSKGAQTSLDLASIGARAIKAEQQTTSVVIAAIVHKGEGERISELLKDVDGLDVVSVVKDEANNCDVINFVDNPQMDENCLVYKHDDNVSFIISGVKESTSKMEFWANSTSFKDNIRKTSFFPSLREAGYTLVDTIANIAYGEDDQDLVTKAEAELQAFGEYVKELVMALPVTVVKSIASIDFTPAVEEATTTEDPAATVETATKTEDEAVVKTEGDELTKEGDELDKGKEEPEVTAEVEPEKTTKTEDEAPAWATQLVAKVDGLTERMGALEETAQITAQKAEEAVKATGESQALVSKAEAVLNNARGTVIAEAEADDDLDLGLDERSLADNDDLHEAGIELY